MADYYRRDRSPSPPRRSSSPHRRSPSPQRRGLEPYGGFGLFHQSRDEYPRHTEHDDIPRRSPDRNRYNDDYYRYKRRDDSRFAATLNTEHGITLTYRPGDGARRTILALCILLVLITLAVVLLLLFYLPQSPLYHGDDGGTDAGGGDDPTSQFRYENAAIASDSATCSQIGREVLQEGGSAVDAAISALLCVGTTNPNNIGIGGGHFMMHYDARHSEMTMYDAREVAPLAATQDMFVNDTTGKSKRGGIAIAVPGDIKGYHEAHRNHGRLPWKRLFEPSIKLARDGFIVTDDLGGAIAYREEVIREEPNLRDRYVKSNGELLAEGDFFTRPRYAETLEAIAYNGGNYFYDEMADDIVRDIQDAGGIITAEDLRIYNVERRNPISISLYGGYKVYTPPPPSSGAVVSLILNILDGYFGASPDADNFFKEQGLLGLTYHRMVEAFKFGFGQRGNLADSSFVNVNDIVNRLTSRRTADDFREMIKDDSVYDIRFYGEVLDHLNDRGTSQLSVIDKYGNAVSVTQTLNFGFGSRVLGTRTGIIFNNEMDDFAVPGGPPNEFGFLPSDVNLIVPGKRPQSSMTPTIVLDSNNDAYMVIGSSGGSRIISAIPQAFSFIHFGEFSLGDAVDQPRINQQWVPADVYYNTDFDQNILNDLQRRGQVIAPEGNRNIYSVVQVVKKGSDGYLYAHSDQRRGKYTGPDGY